MFAANTSCQEQKTLNNQCPELFPPSRPTATYQIEGGLVQDQKVNYRSGDSHNQRQCDQHAEGPARSSQHDGGPVRLRHQRKHVSDPAGTAAEVSVDVPLPCSCGGTTSVTNAAASTCLLFPLNRNGVSDWFFVFGLLCA
jgi:hypothetical protein